ncbi:LysR family transcriptional regulator [Microbacterium album]|uniref:Transcriptional regulator n=1 Tax=Microbacterium album TaxID=2053191 RepID=A0A917MMJ0_9MICO|nr:LysR family transcriptional regulator [Microbacterium album]GGH44734.1 transcriptional regulator [Microbacterium album]
MAEIPFTLRQLEYFDAVASEGSIAAAAQRCRVSASALALAIDELERHLSLQLLVRRKGRGVTLTPAGSRVLSLARRLLTGAETLAEDAWQASTSLTGVLRLGCFSTLAPFLLPAVMQDFQRAHPGLELEYVEASAPELHELLLQGRIDAALLYSVDVSAQLTFDPVREQTPHVVVAEDHPLAGRGSVPLGELISEPLVLLDVEPTRQNTEHLFAALGLRPTVGHTTTSFELARCLVGRGLGYAILFQRPASEVTYDGHRVRGIEISDGVPPTVIGLARPHGAPRTGRYRVLHEFLARS